MSIVQISLPPTPKQLVPPCMHSCHSGGHCSVRKLFLVFFFFFRIIVFSNMLTDPSTSPHLSSSLRFPPHNPSCRLFVSMPRSRPPPPPCIFITHSSSPPSISSWTSFFSRPPPPHPPALLPPSPLLLF